MTKIEFWKRYLKYQPDDDKFCTSISCKNECPYYSNCEGLKMSKEIAESYIKRHESKTKKKDHITDASKKVEEPKPFKTVGIDNSDVTLAKPTVKENL
ncbi:MAG TPA: hypothetical protein PLB16_10505, partial [bacterium]|nr:hypothetical protein [bacterium]